MTRVTSGLNDYRYVASLHIDHPTIDADSMSRGIPINPDRVCRVGEQRRTPNGTPRSGFYDRTHWSVQLESPANADVTHFLRSILERLECSHAFLANIADTGGNAEIFIGLFADRGCDFELPRSLLSNLATAGLGLRLDYYGPDNTPVDT